MDAGIDDPLIVDFINDGYFIKEEAFQTIADQEPAMDFFVRVVAFDIAFLVRLAYSFQINLD